MHDTGPDDITKYLTIRTIRHDGKLESTTIRPITLEEAARYRSMGRASATDLGTLLMLVRKHCPGFADRVAAYRVPASSEDAEIAAEPGQTIITIEFFERSAR